MRQFSIKLTVAVLLISSFIFNAIGQVNNRDNAQVHATTDTPKNQTRFIITIDVTDWQRSMDSLSLCLNYVGRTLPADKADQVQAIGYGVLNRYSSMIRIDTVWLKVDSVKKPDRK